MEDKYKISIDELKAINGYEKLSNEEAEQVINELFKLSEITYYIINKKINKK